LTTGIDQASTAKIEVASAEVWPVELCFDLVDSLFRRQGEEDLIFPIYDFVPRK